jgi:hypothetical protein
VKEKRKEINRDFTSHPIVTSLPNLHLKLPVPNKLQPVLVVDDDNRNLDVLRVGGAFFRQVRFPGVERAGDVDQKDLRKEKKTSVPSLSSVGVLYWACVGRCMDNSHRNRSEQSPADK